MNWLCTQWHTHFNTLPFCYRGIADEGRTVGIFALYNDSLIYLVRKKLNVNTFWDIAQCSPSINQRFRGAYHLHHHGWKQGGQGTNVQQVICSSETSFRYGQHSCTSKKVAAFITTGIRASNPIWENPNFTNCRHCMSPSYGKIYISRLSLLAM
jgi:hypothetical protein